MLGMLAKLFKKCQVIWCSYTKQNDNNLNIIEQNMVKCMHNYLNSW